MFIEFLNTNLIWIWLLSLGPRTPRRWILRKDKDLTETCDVC